MGEIVRTKLSLLVRNPGVWLAIACLAVLNGCGSSSANVITVAVTPSGQSVIVGTTLTFTATEGGVTTPMVTWTCTFVTTPTPPAGQNPTPSPAAACSTANGAVGTITNPQATTVVYNAPTVVPDPTKFPSLVISITATATADTKKTGSAMLTLDSGIAIVLTPATATVPTGEQEQFRITLTNDTQSKGVTWLVTQTSPSSTNPATPIPKLPTCSPGCGTINTMTGLYTAPSTIPTPPTTVTTTPANVTVVVTSNADTTRFAEGTITIIQGGPITFSGISPNFAPQGAQFWDIYLNAMNISSSSQIHVKDPAGGTKEFDSVNNPQQVKVLFPVPAPATSTTTATPQPSSGARLRLTANSNPPDLVLAGTYTISVTDPAEMVTANGAPAAYQFTVVPVRPTSVATFPDGFNLGTLAVSGQGQQSTFHADGGYLGPGGQFANLIFNGNEAAANANSSDSRHLTASVSNASLGGLSAGLYPLSLGRTASPLPVPNSSAVTNLALFPDYSAKGPMWLTGALPPATPFEHPVAAGQNPSAIDIDTNLGVVVVAETVSNAIQLYRIAPQAGTKPGSTFDSLVPIDGVSGQDCTPSAASTTCPVTGVGGVPMNLPTGLSVNSSNHTVAVVNYGSQTVTGGVATITGQTVMDFPIPTPGAGLPPGAITPFSIDISNILQGSVVPAPMPYAIGVDPDTNLALVAYSSTTPSTPANLGFVFNLNPNVAGSNKFGCPATTTLPPPPSPGVGQCFFSEVTLNTGAYPQVAMAPHQHVGVVTPGGSGVVRGVDVTLPANKATISDIMIGAGVVTVAITTPVGFNLTPGNAGSVLIAGVPLPGTTGNPTAVNFNGVFSVAVDSVTAPTSTQSGMTTFSFTVSNTAASGTLPTAQAGIGTVYFNQPGLSFPGSSTTQGIAINPITRSAALADANSTGTNGPQIDLLDELGQATSSITFFSGCTAFVPVPCSNAPEFLGTTNVAWQPFTNSLVSYNPKQQQVSVSDPVALRRFAIVPAPIQPTPGNPPPPQPLLGPGAACIQVANGSTNMLTLWGGVAVDPATNNAFVVESGTVVPPNGSPCPALPSGTQSSAGQIEIINLDPLSAISGAISTTSPSAIKPVHITDILVPSANPGTSMVGGIPKASVPQATLTSTTDLAGVQIFGAGFATGAQVLLDGTAIPSANVTVNSPRMITATIPAASLAMPHKFALQVASNSVTSNAADFLVIRAVDLTSVCSGGMPQPTGVAIADQIGSGPFSPIAVVTNSGCNNLAVIDINPSDMTFGSILNTGPVGTNPQGIAVSPRFALAVVANQGDGTASVIDMTKTPLAPAVSAITTGTNAQPMGVAINNDTGEALIANFNANTVTEINLAQIPSLAAGSTLTPQTISGIQAPIAIAIDPDRGPTNQGIAVVTALQLQSGFGPVGALAVIEIGQAVPALSTTSPTGSVSATPNGIAFDPAAVTGTANNGVFYASSSGGNSISIFNPDTGGGSAVSVGINPTALAYNPQTGGLLTTNFGSQTVSIVDMLANPLRTRQTLGLPGSAQFGVAIDQFTNLAVILDSANNRAFLFEMPN